MFWGDRDGGLDGWEGEGKGGGGGERGGRGKREYNYLNGFVQEIDILATWVFCVRVMKK